MWHRLLPLVSSWQKGVIRDVARVLDMPYSKADAMAKLIPDELGIDLERFF